MAEPTVRPTLTHGHKWGCPNCKTYHIVDGLPENTVHCSKCDQSFIVALPFKVAWNE